MKPLFIIIFLLLSFNLYSQIKISQFDRETTVIGSQGFTNKMERVIGTNLYRWTISFQADKKLEVEFEATEKEFNDLYEFLDYRISVNTPTVFKIGDTEFQIQGNEGSLLFSFPKTPYEIFFRRMGKYELVEYFGKN